MIEQFLADDIHYMFGNPGTVEQGFLDSLEAYPDFKYIMGLQETIAVAMGDGYARATKKPTVVQLHSGVGLGNGIGMMYQAMRGHAPLVVIAGEAGIKYDAMDAQMAADLVSMAKPVTKWATRVVDSKSLLRILRRAIKIASTPPMGPVFVCVPADIMDEINDEEVFPTSLLDTRVAPTTEWINEAADKLKGAQHPLIIVGDGIAFSGAQDELTRLAETLGADVWGGDASEVLISTKHPLYKGGLGHMFGPASAKITQKADAVLVAGTYLFNEVFPNFDGIFTEGTPVIHVDLNAYEIAKNHPTDMAAVADPKLTLGALADALASRMSAEQKQAAAARTTASGEANAAARKAQLEHDASVRGEVPMHASAFMEELAKHVPDDVIIFDEALTVSPDVTRYMPPHLPNHFFQTRGGSLGVGIPGAIGVKVAYPDKTVIGFTGDGGSMYTIQALWTAAHFKIGAKFVICNNQSYMLLKLNILQYWKDQINEPVHTFPHSFELSDPVINFAEMARSMGVPAVCVDRPENVADAVKQMLETDGPFLIDMVITDHVPGT
jgi:benzoylformate decarboxylase